MATDIEGRQPLGTPFGNPLQGVNVSQQPVDLGGGFEDPMDPCTMCMQGQQEIQQAYNELTQSCNACQTQQNLKNLQQQGCQGCNQAQQVIQNVQKQSTGCASCGTQPMLFQSSHPMPLSQQQFGQSLNLMPLTSQGSTIQPSQGLIQPMLTPLTGTGQQLLTTVTQQPGMMAGQLPIAIERGAGSQMTPQNILTTTMMPQMTGTGGMETTQPMVVGGMMTTSPQINQPTLMGNIPAPPPQMVQQPAPVAMIPPPAPPPPMMVQQPAPPAYIPPPPPPMVQQPTIQIPQYTPAQIAALQQYTQSIQPFGGAQIGISGVGGIAAGTGGGTGKAPGATVGTDVPGVVLGGSGYGFGGVGISGPGIGPGAFDVHRPDLHAGGGWHMPLPLGTQGILNLY